MEGAAVPAQHEYDLTGMQCPMPIVQLSRLIKQCRVGESLKVVANDPAFCFDVESWCRRTRHELVELNQTKDECTAVIRKKGTDAE